MGDLGDARTAEAQGWVRRLWYVLLWMGGAGGGGERGELKIKARERFLFLKSFPRNFSILRKVYEKEFIASALVSSDRRRVLGRSNISKARAPHMKT